MQCGTIVVRYEFPSGTQRPGMPEPGKTYTGTAREAYLPDDDAGREVCKMLKVVSPTPARARKNTTILFVLGNKNNHELWQDEDQHLDLRWRCASLSDGHAHACMRLCTSCGFSCMSGLPAGCIQAWPVISSRHLHNGAYNKFGA